MDSACKVVLISSNSTYFDFKVLYIFQSVWSMFLSNPIKYSRERWEACELDDLMCSGTR